MPSNSNAPSHQSRRHRRRNYTSVASDDRESEDSSEDGDHFQDEPTQSSLDAQNEEQEDSVCDMSVTILDSAQKRFPIPCNADWKVEVFKRQSAKIHKVPPAQQRLIFRGKMLTDDQQTLRDYKIDSSDVIIHLFPKPRVVITATKSENDAKSLTTSRNTHNDTDDDGDSGIVDNDGSNGAHIPSIIIDQEEQDRRGQILVLGSVEIAESQNNVKMLSLLLVMICAMRLLALFTIAMGAAEEPQDSYSPNNAHHHNHTEGGNFNHDEVFDNDFLDDTVDPDFVARTWQTQDYFDLLVSAIGFYVGTLGMKATQENTFRLATTYAIGTIVAGIGWNLWNVYEYIRFYKEQEDYRESHNDDGNSADNSNDDELPPLTRDDLITVAFFTILMPLFVWFLCCVRAFEFRRLLREAEEEAAERIQSEYVVREGDNTDNDRTTEIV